MLKKVIAVIAITLMPAASVVAQSDGSAQPTPADSSTEARPTSIPGIATSSAVAPAPLEEPVPVEPSSASAPPAAVPTNSLLAAPSENEPTFSQSPNNILYVILGVVAALGFAGYGVWKGTQGNKKEEKSTDRCAPLKTKLKQKKVELASIEGQISLQQAALDALKDKLQSKVEDVAKDKVAEALGKEAQAAKELYESAQSKYEKAKQLIDALKNTKAKLTGDVRSLETAYIVCMGGAAAAVAEVGLEINLPGLHPKLTLYNVVSSDGYLAQKDGGEDFIPDELWPKTLEVFKKYDTLVMGRKSYAAIQEYSSTLREPFEALKLRKIVVSRDENFTPKSGYEVIRTVDEITGLPGRVLVCSGPELNNELYKRDLVGDHIFETVPTILGDGIKPADRF